MTPLDWTITAGLLVSNCAAFFLMGLDKWRALHRGWRVPEPTLLVWCALLGAPGGWLGMQIFRHKIRKPRFGIGVPAMMLAQIALVTAYLRYWR